MASTTRLRVAKADDAPPKPQTITEAARAGDRLAELRALRLILANACGNPGTPARDLASLSRRLIEVGQQVEELEALERQGGEDGEQPAPDEAFDPAAV